MIIGDLDGHEEKDAFHFFVLPDPQEPENREVIEQTAFHMARQMNAWIQKARSRQKIITSTENDNWLRVEEAQCAVHTVDTGYTTDIEPTCWIESESEEDPNWSDSSSYSSSCSGSNPYEDCPLLRLTGVRKNIGDDELVQHISRALDILPTRLMIIGDLDGHEEKDAFHFFVLPDPQEPENREVIEQTAFHMARQMNAWIQKARSRQKIITSTENDNWLRVEEAQCAVHTVDTGYITDI